MTTKTKIVFFAVMTLNALVAIFCACKGEWALAAINGLTVLWMATFWGMERFIQKLIRDLEFCYAALAESAKRERIRQKEFNEMRQRAESAEKKLQQMIDDTPARGKDGRYVKRDNE